MAEDKKPLPIAESAEQILAIDDRPIDTVEVPEWGLAVQVRAVDARSALLISKSATSEPGKTDIGDYVMKTLLEGIVRPKFNFEQLSQLMEKSDVAVTRIYDAIKGKKKEPPKN